MPSRKAFSIQSEYYPILRRWNNEERGILLLALINWADGKPIDESSPTEPRLQDIFELITSAIERISAKNSQNGSLGGRPKKNPATKHKTALDDDPLSYTDTDFDEILDGDPTEPPDLPNTTLHGKNGLVRLSSIEYAKLLSEFDQERLQAAIDYLDTWAARRNPDKIQDWYALTRKAIVENWAVGSSKNNALPQSIPIQDIPSSEAYNEKF